MRKLLYLIFLMPFLANAQTSGIKVGAPIIRNDATDKYPTGYQRLINGGLHSGTIAGRDSLLSVYPGLLKPFMEYNTPNQKWMLNATATAWVNVTPFAKTQVDSIFTSYIQLDTFSNVSWSSPIWKDKIINKWTLKGAPNPDFPPTNSPTVENTGYWIGTTQIDIVSGVGVMEATQWNNETGKILNKFVRAKDDTQPNWGQWTRIWTDLALPMGATGQSIRVRADLRGFEAYTPSAGNSGTVTSITRGLGIQDNGTAITTTGTISVDTSKVKSKEGALIDYNNLVTRINTKQNSLPAYVANQILYGDGSSTPVSSTGMVYNGAGGISYVGLNPTINVTTTSTTNASYAGFNFYNDANILAGSLQIGGTGTAPLVRNNLFIGARIPGQSLLFVNGNVSSLNEMARFDGSGRLGVGVPTPVAWVDVKANTASVPSFKMAPSATGVTPAASTAGGFYMGSDYRPHVVSTTVDNSIAYLTDIAANARTPIPVAANATMVLNSDYLNTTATQYTLTLPATTGFSTDGSKIITVLATGAGGLKVLVPSGYALQSGTSFATTTGTGGFTLTQGQKGQLIPIGTNSYYLQPLYGTITLY